jgi:hypothetical protein
MAGDICDAPLLRIGHMHTASSLSTAPHSSLLAKMRAHLGRGGSENAVVTNVAYVVAAAVVVASAVIHLHLWLSGYRHIATIGPLFLAQVIAGGLIALFIVVARNVLAAVIGFGFVASTLAGFLISINVGLFGFEDSFAAPYAHMAFIVEIAAMVVLVVAIFLTVRQTARK